MRRVKRARQIEFQFPTWGGKRKGAGRKPKGRRAGVPHRKRPVVSRHTPAHVTLKVADDIWSLRGASMSQVILGVFGEAKERLDVRIIQFSIQANHIHMIVEAEDEAALARAMKGLCVRLARAINRRMRRKGRVFADRYHVHVLRTPAEVRNATRYVRDNRRIHAAREGWLPRDPGCDPLAAGPCPSLFPEPRRAFVATPRSWLLRTALSLPPPEPASAAAESALEAGLT